VRIVPATLSDYFHGTGLDCAAWCEVVLFAIDVCCWREPPRAGAMIPLLFRFGLHLTRAGPCEVGAYVSIYTGCCGAALDATTAYRCRRAASAYRACVQAELSWIWCQPNRPFFLPNRRLPCQRRVLDGSRWPEPCSICCRIAQFLLPN
jgi:hypothetical protein